MFLLCNSHFHSQRLFKVRVSMVDGATNTVIAAVDSAPMKVVSKFLKGRKKSRSKICSTPAVVLPGALARSGSFSSSGFVSDDATAPMPARSRLARRVRPPARFSDSFRGPLGDLVEDDAEDDYDDDGERVSVKANDDNDSAHTRSDFSATVSDEDLVSSASGRKRTASVANHSHNAPHVGATDFYDDYGVAANVRSASTTADVTDLGEERPAKRQKSGGGGSGGFTLPQLDTHDHSSDMDDRPRFRPTSAGPTKSASPSEFKSPVAAVGDDRRASYDDLVVFDLAAAELAQRASSESVPDAKHPGMPAPSTPLSLRSTSPAPAPTGSRVSPRFLTNADKKSEILALFSELDFASKVSVFDRLVEVPAARAWPAMQQCIFNHGLQYEIMQAEAPLQKAYQVRMCGCVSVCLSPCRCLCVSVYIRVLCGLCWAKTSRASCCCCLRQTRWHPFSPPTFNQTNPFTARTCWRSCATLPRATARRCRCARASSLRSLTAPRRSSRPPRCETGKASQPTTRSEETLLLRGCEFVLCARACVCVCYERIPVTRGEAQVPSSPHLISPHPGAHGVKFEGTHSTLF